MRHNRGLLFFCDRYYNVNTTNIGKLFSKAHRSSLNKVLHSRNSPEKKTILLEYQHLSNNYTMLLNTFL